MKSAKHVPLVLGLLFLSAAVLPANAATVTFDWSMTETAGTIDPNEAGSGTLTATVGQNGDILTGITGSIDGATITGLTSFNGSDNLIFPTGTAFVDTNGIAFKTSAGQSVDLFSFATQGTPSGSAYSEKFNDGNFVVGTFTATTPVPLRTSWSFMLLGLAGIGGLTLSRNKGVSGESSLGLAAS